MVHAETLDYHMTRIDPMQPEKVDLDILQGLKFDVVNTKGHDIYRFESIGIDLYRDKQNVERYISFVLILKMIKFNI